MSYMYDFSEKLKLKWVPYLMNNKHLISNLIKKIIKLIKKQPNFIQKHLINKNFVYNKLCSYKASETFTSSYNNLITSKLLYKSVSELLVVNVSLRLSFFI